MPFQKGHKKIEGTGLKKGDKCRKTIIRSLTDITQLKELALKNMGELMNDDNKQVRTLMTAQASKYIFPQKRETDLRVSGTIVFKANTKIVPNIENEK
jgi:hypothetical protein